MKYILGLFVLVFSLGAFAEEKILSEHAPEDQPVSAATDAEMKAFFKAMEPYSQEALKSYPPARNKFLRGLPVGENFFLTTRLHDSAGKVEQVFILVVGISGDIVSGIIYNEIRVVSGFENGQKYKFPESEIIDWLITKPDGSEEGNYAGKFLDTYQGK